MLMRWLGVACVTLQQSETVVTLEEPRVDTERLLKGTTRLLEVSLSQISRPDTRLLDRWIGDRGRSLPECPRSGRFAQVQPQGRDPIQGFPSGSVRCIRASRRSAALSARPRRSKIATT